MKRALAVVLWVFCMGSLAHGMSACGTDDIPIAMISDAITEAGEDAAAIPCTVGDVAPADSGDAGQWFCDPYACGAPLGTWKQVPASCPSDMDYGAECDCDGVSYFNDCLRLRARATVASTGVCGNPNKFCTSSSILGIAGNCPGETTACALVFAPPVPPEIFESEAGAAVVDGICSAATSLPAPSGGPCWVLPKECPSSTKTYFRSCLTGTCMDACSAIAKGGLLLPCIPSNVPDASSD